MFGMRRNSAFSSLESPQSPPVSANSSIASSHLYHSINLSLSSFLLTNFRLCFSVTLLGQICVWNSLLTVFCELSCWNIRFCFVSNFSTKILEEYVAHVGFRRNKKTVEREERIIGSLVEFTNRFAGGCLGRSCSHFWFEVFEEKFLLCCKRFVFCYMTSRQYLSMISHSAVWCFGSSILFTIWEELRLKNLMSH